MASKGVSVTDLLSGSKQLSNVPESKPNKGGSGDADPDAIRQFELIYEKYSGDIDLIFQELKANPAKAKKPKHAPKSANDFANKYIQGYYSLVDDEGDAADSKSNHK